MDSSSTQRVDALLKLTQCFCNWSILHYLIVMPDDQSVLHHRRGGGERIDMTIYMAGRLRLDPPGVEMEIVAFFAASSKLE